MVRWISYPRRFDIKLYGWSRRGCLHYEVIIVSGILRQKMSRHCEKPQPTKDFKVVLFALLSLRCWTNMVPKSERKMVQDSRHSSTIQSCSNRKKIIVWRRGYCLINDGKMSSHWLLCPRMGKVYQIQENIVYNI